MKGKIFQQISAFSDNNFAAGSISIQTDRLQVSDRDEISVSNQSLGNSGNLKITARDLMLANSGTLSAEANYGDRGNIELNTQNLTLSDRSKINTSALGTATGGKIKINNRDNIVLFDRGQILADALQGDGGKIEIDSQSLFAAGENNISASSQFGLDGTVKITTINSDRRSNLTQLPEQPFDATQQIVEVLLSVKLCLNIIFN